MLACSNVRPPSIYGCIPSLVSSRTTLTLYSISRRRGAQHSGFDARIHVSNSTAQSCDRKLPIDAPAPGSGFRFAYAVRVADQIRSCAHGHERRRPSWCPWPDAPSAQSVITVKRMM